MPTRPTSRTRTPHDRSRPGAPPRVDIIVAVRNEEKNLVLFAESVRSLTLPGDVELGMIFVEDSSTDATLPVLCELASKDPLVHYYALEKGFGQGPAIVFGLSQSRADATIMMDVDGSHPVDVIPEMIERYLAGARIVQCRRGLWLPSCHR